MIIASAGDTTAVERIQQLRQWNDALLAHLTWGKDSGELDSSVDRLRLNFAEIAHLESHLADPFYRLAWPITAKDLKHTPAWSRPDPVLLHCFA